MYLMFNEQPLTNISLLINNHGKKRNYQFPNSLFDRMAIQFWHHIRCALNEVKRNDMIQWEEKYNAWKVEILKERIKYLTDSSYTM